MSLIGHKSGFSRIVAVTVSATLHGVAAAALIGLSSTDPPVPLPMIAVEIVAQAPSGAGGPAITKGAQTPRAGARRAALAKAKAPVPAVSKAKAQTQPLIRRSASEAAIRPARPAKSRISKHALRAAARSAYIKRRLSSRPNPQIARYRKANPGKRATPGKAAATNIAALAYRPPRPGGGGYGNPLPKYPQYARRRGAEGRVVLAVRVGAGGRAQSVVLRQSSGHADLDAAAVAAVRRWRFAPASRGGVSVEGLAIVPIRFRLVAR